MSALNGLFNAAIVKAAGHISGPALTDDQHSTLSAALIDSTIVGVHSVEDGSLLVVTRDRRLDGGRHYALKGFDPDGTLMKGNLAGSRSAMVREFERRAGVTWGQTPPPMTPLRTSETREDKIRRTLGYLLTAVRSRRHVNRRAGPGKIP
jgi:hypothetical protein